MYIFPIIWTDQMQLALAELQQRPLLRRLLAFAEQRGVELFAVGGALRDICLGRRAQDVDLAMMGDVMDFAEAFANHLGAAFVPMDAERGEARVVYRQHQIFDFARFKGETIIADLHHRDFTVNATACPLATLLTQAAPEIIDTHGGWQDLQARIIRIVSPASFRQDPLRILRAFRLGASLDFTIDPATLAAMDSVVVHLVDVAAERIHRQRYRLVADPPSSPHVAAMARLGLLDVLFPELAATRGIPCQPGDPLDLFEHSVRAYEAVEDLIRQPASHAPMLAEAVTEYVQAEERRAMIKWAALLHAIGAAVACRGASEYLMASPGDDDQSAQLWEHIGKRLKLSSKQIDYIKTLIAQLPRGLRLLSLEAQGCLTLRLVHGWCKEVGDSMLGVFLLAIGHALAGGHEKSSEPSAALGQLTARVWDVYRRCILPVITAPRLVTGDDLQQIFDLTPGPRFKSLLDELEVARVEGCIRTRAEALQWVEAQLR